MDTEALSDKAGIEAFGFKIDKKSEIVLDKIPQKYLNEMNGRLPWEIKSRILGLRGGDWIPMLMEYAEKNWKMNENAFNFNNEDEKKSYM